MPCTARSGPSGVTGLIALLTGARLWLGLFGGLFLLWMAWQTWRSPAASQAARLEGARNGGPWSSFAGTFALTLSNPMTILSFIAIFAALAGQGPIGSPALMVLGVLLGSAAWWFVLSGGVSFDAASAERDTACAPSTGPRRLCLAPSGSTS